MEKTIHVQADMRIEDLLTILQEIEEAKCHVIRAIDSLNYGEGYEVRIYGVTGRLYDDERSDEALLNKDFIDKNISWSEAMDQATEKLKGRVSLKIEIDRWSESTMEIQENVVNSIKNKLRLKGLNVA